MRTRMLPGCNIPLSPFHFPPPLSFQTLTINTALPHKELRQHRETAVQCEAQLVRSITGASIHGSLPAHHIEKNIMEAYCDMVKHAQSFVCILPSEPSANFFL